MFCRLARGLLVALVVGWLAASPATASDWLDGRGTWVSQAAVIERLQRADVVLMGEVHDSPDVHARQVALLEAMADAPDSPPIVLAMEQLDLQNRAALERLDGDASLDGRALAEAGGFDEAGWGWEHYGPLFTLAAERGWPVRPLNLSRARAREIVRGGSEWRLALPPDQVAVIERLAPDLSLPETLQTALIEDLQRVHCGDMDPAFARRIARAQVARDILMADAIRSIRDTFPGRLVVAVMGNQHARQDRGVAYWLRLWGDEANHEARPSVVSIGMLPVTEEEIPNIRDEVSHRYDLRRLTEPDVKRSDRCASD